MFRWLLVAFLSYPALGKAGESTADSETTHDKSTQLNDEVLLEQFSTKVTPLLEKHCYDCHSGSAAEAGVDLTFYDSLESIRKSPSVWEQIRGLVKIGAMPPPDDAEPLSEEVRQEITSWVHNALHYVDYSEPIEPTPITVRRLNSVEYDHAIRDIFGSDFETAKAIGFVTDEVGNGFDNQGEVLTISPLSIEKFLDAAHYVAGKAITVDVEGLRRQVKDGTSIEFGKNFDSKFDLAAGQYEILVRMEFGFEQNFSVDAEVFVDGESLGVIEVAPRRENYRWEKVLTEGEHTVTVHFVDNEKIGGQGGERRQLRIERVSIKGPVDGVPRFPKEHRSVVIATPNETTTVAQAAEAIARNFLPKAYRRPPSEEAVARMVNQIVTSSESGASFETAVMHGVELALVAPEFFFRLEVDSGVPATDERFGEHVEYVDHYDMASRLSFFLWSSIPDQELLALAAEGKLQDPEVLRQQVDRMLDDSKIESGLVRQFYGQWLGLRNLSTVQVDQDRFPKYNEKLSSAMIRETELLCLDILRHGKLLDVLAADYTYVNPRLADFYNIAYDGMDPMELYGADANNRRARRRQADFNRENEFVRASLDAHRQGLLTHASILTLTSNPTRTSPVKRGKWVLENIVGDPPPAAPPGVPTLEQSVEGKGQMTLREQLELHRANPSCASCHKIMDPIGLGLENFDAVGQYRSTDGDLAINAAGELADGRTFSGSIELLTHLLSDEEKFAKHFSTKLLTFALGRGLVREDAPVIDQILNNARQQDFEMRELVKSIVLSDLFRYRSRTEIVGE